MLKPNDINEDIDFGHGRIETRCRVITDLSLVPSASKWKGLKSIIEVERIRDFKNIDKQEQEVSYYISTHIQAKNIANGVRKHWGIENKVHWVLDVAFNKDHSRKRAGNAAKNFTNINRVVLNMLRRSEKKVSIVNKRFAAGWDNNYLLSLLKI